MPKVTALLPLYNGMAYIRESLESVQSQTLSDWEFIIVNDYGSDDGCTDVIRKYAEKDSRIKLVQAETRLGLSSSLNLGLDLARGEYIARVDVDDPSKPDRFEKQVRFMDEHPEICLCSCYCETLTQKGKHEERVPCQPEDLKAAMLFPNEIRHFGAMLRLDYFNNKHLRYDPDSIVEDYELWVRAIMQGAQMANIPEVLVTHRWGFGNISIEKGDRLECEARSISAKILRHVGVETDRYYPELLSGWRAHQRAFAHTRRAEFLRQGYSLLEEIQVKNKLFEYCDEKALKRMLIKRWDWIRTSCRLSYNSGLSNEFCAVNSQPTVSVVLPTYRSASDVSRAIDSVCLQTFKNWELLVINDFGSDDGTAELVRMYAHRDARIRLIQAKKRLGLARSLNLGLREAKGIYIARIDADDISYPERFEKQIRLMDNSPEVGICGTWQKHIGKDCQYIHEAEPDPEYLRTNLIFWCDLCHSTLMLRKSALISNNLYYDPSYYAEDHELWTRCMEHMVIRNIPEVLGIYSAGDGITKSKLHMLKSESGQITANALYRYLNISIPHDQTYLLDGWDNEAYRGVKREENLIRLKQIFEQIWAENEKQKVFYPQALLQAMAKKWHWAKDNIDWEVKGYHVTTIQNVFRNNPTEVLLKKYEGYRHHYPGFRNRILKISEKVSKKTGTMIKKILKKILRPAADFFRKITYKLMRDVIIDIQDSMKREEERQNQKIRQMISGFSPVAYVPGQKVRVLFLVQVSAFWPAQQSIYESMRDDERFDARIVCYDKQIDNTIKTDTTRAYLCTTGYSFIPWEEFVFEDFNPHIVFLQTQYDSNRSAFYNRQNLMQRGNRVVFLSYGVEIGDTIHARNDQFIKPNLASWRIYTLSEQMAEYYYRYTRCPSMIRALGLPRFDNLYHREKYPPREEVLRRANGRKIVLWKVHFPKLITQMNQTILVTPEMREYLKFAEKIKDYGELFFVFMPHPRFREFNESEIIRRQTEKLLMQLSEFENVYIDDDDNYYPSLLNADAIIIDRSAVMVEAGAVGVPVLYMSNSNYYEPMTTAIRALVDSYEQGQTYQDMVDFINRVKDGADLKRESRQQAFRQCVPYFDGKCGERIKEDIFHSIVEETADHLDQMLSRTRDEMLGVIDKSVERWTWERYKRSLREREELAWNLSYEFNPERMAKSFSSSHTYDYRFYQHNRFGSVNSAQRILSVLLSWIPHDSCVDFGCGTGTWLWVASALGVKEIYGIDREYVPTGMLMIDPDAFHTADLEKPLSLPKQFSFAMSMEVAEHLCADAADTFVRSLCQASNIVLFSAAHPGQGGDGHVNEQPVEYWEEKFAAHRFHSIAIKQFFQKDNKVERWYRENIILFAKEGVFQRIEKDVKQYATSFIS